MFGTLSSDWHHLQSSDDDGGPASLHNWHWKKASHYTKRKWKVSENQRKNEGKQQNDTPEPGGGVGLGVGSGVGGMGVGIGVGWNSPVCCVCVTEESWCLIVRDTFDKNVPWIMHDVLPFNGNFYNQFN